VDATALDRAPGCHEGLRGDLSTKDPLTRLFEVYAAKDVHLNYFEVEQF
jgi:hypothetical protein